MKDTISAAWPFKVFADDLPGNTAFAQTASLHRSKSLQVKLDYFVPAPSMLHCAAPKFVLCPFPGVTFSCCARYASCHCTIITAMVGTVPADNEVLLG